jgi:hypothetical protein
MIESVPCPPLMLPPQTVHLNFGVAPGVPPLSVAVTGTFCPVVAVARVPKEMVGQKRGDEGLNGVVVGHATRSGHTTQARHIADALREPQAGPVLTVTIAS